MHASLNNTLHSKLLLACCHARGLAGEPAMKASEDGAGVWTCLIHCGIVPRCELRMTCRRPAMRPPWWQRAAWAP